MGSSFFYFHLLFSWNTICWFQRTSLIKKCMSSAFSLKYPILLTLCLFCLLLSELQTSSVSSQAQVEQAAASLQNGKVCVRREGSNRGPPSLWVAHPHSWQSAREQRSAQSLQALLHPPAYLVSHAQQEKHHSIIQWRWVGKMKKKLKMIQKLWGCGELSETVRVIDEGDSEKSLAHILKPTLIKDRTLVWGQTCEHALPARLKGPWHSTATYDICQQYRIKCAKE